MRIILLLAALFLPMTVVHALDATTFVYSPPALSEFRTGTEVKLNLVAAGISEARALIATTSGYRAVALQRSGENLLANLKVVFGDLPEIQFQIKPARGAAFESQTYSLAPFNSADLKLDFESEQAKKQKLEAELSCAEQNLVATKGADPETLAKSKNQELARAVLLLSKKERELEELLGAPKLESATKAEEVSGVP